MGTDAPLSDISEDKLVQFETEVRMIPQFDTENPVMISQGPSVCIFNKEDPQEVMASWLFTQYLLTNEVQIAYAQTEGYVPVTEKAQKSEAYQEYLSRAGEDNELYYNVKMEATALLLDNIENTFVTPVFNGSASLRDAAGQLVENTVKAQRREQTVDESFMTDLYADTIALYRLDQLTVQGNAAEAGKVELGELPTLSVVLLVTLIAVWVLLGLYAAVGAIKNRKKD